MIGPEKWQCLVEADIDGTQFDVWGSSPPVAIDRAIEEAWRRVPGQTSGRPTP